jgi:hypothetical protein
MMASDFRCDARELVADGHYDHNQTHQTAKIFLLVGGNRWKWKRGLPFRDPNPVQGVWQSLVVIAHMDKVDADKYMLDQALIFMDICRVAEDEYRSRYDHSVWPPAKHARDSKAVPSCFGANTLYPSTPPGSTGSFVGSCYNCCKPGHISHNCPSPKQDKGRPSPYCSC